MPTPAKINEVRCRCQFCGKVNPAIEAHAIGGDEKSRLVQFVMGCCRKILGCQLEQIPFEAPKQADGSLGALVS